MGTIKTPSVEILKKRFQKIDARKQNTAALSRAPPNFFRKASVLIPLVFTSGELYVLLTKRSSKLRSHSGLVAFPGGMSDSTDADEVATALREAEEEIGLESKDVDVISVHSFAMMSPNTLVTPVLGLIPQDFVPKVNEDEVEFAFQLPLSRFLSADGVTIETKGKESHRMHRFHDRVSNRDVVTYGFTAGFCVEVALVAYQSDLTFRFHRDKVVTKDTALRFGSGSRVIENLAKSNY